MKKRKNNVDLLGESVVDLAIKLLPNASKWLLTYKLKSTNEIYSDEIYTTDPPDKLLKYIGEQWFDDDEAELISITKL